jgi:hypothetical protein
VTRELSRRTSEIQGKITIDRKISVNCTLDLLNACLKKLHHLTYLSRGICRYASTEENRRAVILRIEGQKIMDSLQMAASIPT